ncbi:YraN family protein [Rhizobium sp. RCC_161_2]|uniref:YraN family protein n=1 Tax=Rhizobium sp. RCC_161_2 TaxID=3239219 RepID=UPI003525225C
MADTGERLKRQNAWRRGHISEYLAAAFLLLKGYRILAIRHRTKLGEIDIIARKGDLAVFVEVKARRGDQEAIDAVSFSAQKRIRAASDLWLARQPDYALLSQRYDIVAILPGRWPRHFQDAF